MNEALKLCTEIMTEFELIHEDLDISEVMNEFRKEY